MAWRVVVVAMITQWRMGPRPTADGKCLDVPTIFGIGGSLLYFVDSYA